MQKFLALSLCDKLSICWNLARGKAPHRPEMAPAAIELAESYERQSPFYVWINRWLPLFMLVGFGYVTGSNLADGDLSLLFPYSLIVVIAVGNLLFNPLVWPKNRTKGLKASRGKIALR